MKDKELRRVANFARDKGGYSSTWIIKCINNGSLTGIEIDDTKFVVLNERAKQFKKKGE